MMAELGLAQDSFIAVPIWQEWTSKGCDALLSLALKSRLVPCLVYYTLQQEKTRKLCYRTDDRADRAMRAI